MSKNKKNIFDPNATDMYPTINTTSINPNATDMAPTVDKMTESYCEGRPCNFKHPEYNIKNIDTGTIEPSLKKKINNIK